jgi:multicomponent K+:H+ antiporter subunit E
MKTSTRRWLPSPLLSCVLFIVWPMLNQSWSLGQLLLGLILAVVIPWFTEPLRERPPRLRRPLLAAKLVLLVLKDIITSNIQVAKLILGRESRIKPAFVWVPLTITDDHGIVALAGIITMTPGTLSADLSADRQYLLVHAFNVDDEADLIDSIKTRYEKPLLEIFQ